VSNHPKFFTSTSFKDYDALRAISLLTIVILQLNHKYRCGKPQQHAICNLTTKLRCQLDNVPPQAQNTPQSLPLEKNDKIDQSIKGHL